MKRQTLRACLERVSFIFWILFTIASIALAGLGIEGVLFAGFMFLVSSAGPVHFPLAAVSTGSIGVLLSILWRQVGINHFHYLRYDSVPFADDEEEDKPSHILRDLILKVENSSGYDRNDARAMAKTWLIDHVSSLDEEDILLAKTHFGYLLPAGWGS